MQRYKLAHVHWHLGQTLLPDHFQTEEDSIEAEIRLASDLSGLPSRGVGGLSWNESLLSEGNLAISAIQVVMPGGFLIDVPGNALLPPFSLEATGKANLSVFLHLLDSTRNAEGVPLYGDDPKTLQRVMHQLVLSNEAAIDGALSSFKLIEMEKNMDGVWKVVPSYVPPLLLVGSNPFASELIADLDDLLERTRNQLLTRISDTYLRSDRLTNARRALFEVLRLQAVLTDMKHEVYPHPYFFFSSLRSFYFEVCCDLEMLPDGELPTYSHENLGPGFLGWMKLLSQGLRPEGTRTTHVPFVHREGQFILTPLPEKLVSATDVYLLVQRSDPAERLSLEGVKLSSPSRLPLVRRLALKGIPFTHIPHTPFPHSFGPEIDFYRLTAGEEWEFAVREDAIAFFTPPALENAQVSVFWRKA